MSRSFPTVVACLLLAALPAFAQQTDRKAAVAVPGSLHAGYATPVVVVHMGDELSFVNLDLALHNFVHDVRLDPEFVNEDPPVDDCCPASITNRARCPLFCSPLAPIAGIAEVIGMDRLVPGRLYPFFCSTHPQAMKGTLAVLPQIP